MSPLVLLLDVDLAVEIFILVQIRPEDPANILSLCAAVVLQVPHSVLAKDDAPENISSM